MLKVCASCKKKLSINAFKKIGKYYRSYCVSCHASKNLEYYYKNSKKMIKKHLMYFKDNPWAKTYCNIVSRCKKHPHYKTHGIKCQITVKELKRLWFRDKAYLMQKPSIDRRNGKGSYNLGNCRYIELIDNQKRKKCYWAK